MHSAQGRSYSKHVEGQVKPVMVFSNPSFGIDRSQAEMNPSMVSEFVVCHCFSLDLLAVNLIYAISLHRLIFHTHMVIPMLTDYILLMDHKLLWVLLRPFHMFGLKFLIVTVHVVWLFPLWRICFFYPKPCTAPGDRPTTYTSPIAYWTCRWRSNICQCETIQWNHEEEADACEAGGSEQTPQK